MKSKENFSGSRAALSGDVQRLWDLVRYCRHELYSNALISDEEYAALAIDHPAVYRLESYDEMRGKIRKLKWELNNANRESKQT